MTPPDGPAEGRGGTGSEDDDEGALAFALADRLRDVQRRVSRLEGLDPAAREALQRRLIALTDASKHGLRRTAERLDALEADLAAGRYADPPA